MIDKYLPKGVSRLLRYRQRFADLGLPTTYAWKREYRKALESSVIELMPRSQLKQLACVVDVGANLGEWAISMAKLTKAGCIIAFEPIPEIFSQLVQNCRLYSQILCRQIAIGASCGETAMNVYPVHQLSSVLSIYDDALYTHSGPGADKERSIIVPLSTLDRELETVDEISVLKVDVQGYEAEVFSGAVEALKRTKVLVTEITYVPYYKGDRQFLDLWRHLISIAPFDLWGVSAPRVSSAGRPMWADAVFVQKM